MAKSVPFYNLLLYQTVAIIEDKMDRRSYFNMKQSLFLFETKEGKDG